MPNQNSAKVPIRTIRRNEIRANASIFSSDNGAGSDSARVVAQAAAASTSNAFPAADSIWPASTPIALKDRKAIKVSIRRQTSALKNDSVKIGAAGAELLGPKPDNSDLFPHRFAETPAASPLLSFEAITNAKMALQLANNTSLSTPSPSTPTAPPNQPEEPLVRWPPRPSLLKTFFPVLEESQFCISCQQQLWHVWMHGCLRQSSAIRRSTEDPSQLLLAHAGLVPSLFLSDELPPLPSTDFILPQRINIYAPSPELPETVTPHTFQTLSATQQSDLHALRSALWDSQRALSHWTHQVSRVEKSLKEAKKRSKVAEEWLCKKMECWEKSWMACGMGIAALASWGANAYLERKQVGCFFCERTSLQEIIGLDLLTLVDGILDSSTARVKHLTSSPRTYPPKSQPTSPKSPPKNRFSRAWKASFSNSVLGNRNWKKMSREIRNFWNESSGLQRMSTFVGKLAKRAGTSLRRLWRASE